MLEQIIDIFIKGNILFLTNIYILVQGFQHFFLAHPLSIQRYNLFKKNKG